MRIVGFGGSRFPLIIDPIRPGRRDGPSADAISRLGNLCSICPAIVFLGERFSGITHLVGAALALAGMVVLIVMASRHGDRWKIVSFSVYGASLFFLYLVSTLYHSLRGRVEPRESFARSITPPYTSSLPEATPRSPS